MPVPRSPAPCLRGAVPRSGGPAPTAAPPAALGPARTEGPAFPRPGVACVPCSACRRGSGTRSSTSGSCASLLGVVLLLGQDLVGQRLDARGVEREGQRPRRAVVLHLLDQPLHQPRLLTRCQ